MSDKITIKNKPDTVTILVHGSAVELTRDEARQLANDLLKEIGESRTRPVPRYPQSPMPAPSNPWPAYPHSPSVPGPFDNPIVTCQSK